MIYIVTAKDGLMSLTTGQRIKRGSRISDNAFEPDRMRALLDEGSIAPVKAEAKPVPAPLGLTGLKGLTTLQLASLAEIGITTLAALADAATDVLTEIEGVGPATAEKWRTAARKLLDNGSNV